MKWVTEGTSGVPLRIAVSDWLWLLQGFWVVVFLFPHGRILLLFQEGMVPPQAFNKNICARIKTRDDDFNRADAVRHPNYQKHVSSDTTLERRYPHQWYILISNGNLEHVCCCTDWSGMP